MNAVLGQRDPAGVSDVTDVVCGATSDVVPHSSAAFVCTRPPGHAAADREHVASGPYPVAGLIAIAAWVDGGAPRVIDAITLQRAQRRGQA